MPTKADINHQVIAWKSTGRTVIDLARAIPVAPSTLTRWRNGSMVATQESFDRLCAVVLEAKRKKK